MSPGRQIRGMRRLITLLVWIIIVLLSIIAKMHGHAQSTWKPAKQNTVVSNEKTIGCISIVNDSVLYINMNGEQLTVLRIERGFRLQNHDHYRLRVEHKYNGFFIVHFSGTGEAEKAYLIVSGTQRGEHYSKWYQFKHR